MKMLVEMDFVGFLGPMIQIVRDAVANSGLLETRRANAVKRAKTKLGGVVRNLVKLGVGEEFIHKTVREEIVKHVMGS